MSYLNDIVSQKASSLVPIYSIGLKLPNDSLILLSLYHCIYRFIMPMNSIFFSYTCSFLARNF